MNKSIWIRINQVSGDDTTTAILFIKNRKVCNKMPWVNKFVRFCIDMLLDRILEIHKNKYLGVIDSQPKDSHILTPLLP